MDTEYKFWLAIVRTIVGGVCVLIVSMAGCTAHEDYRISQDIQRGADPLTAACAHSASPQSSTCTPLAYKR